MAVLGLIRRPLDVALTGAEGALDASLAVVRGARGLIEEDVAETRWTVADPPPAEPTAPRRQPAAPVPASAPPIPEPSPQVPEGDGHVSEEPVPVAEYAEAGAEDGA